MGLPPFVRISRSDLTGVLDGSKEGQTDLVNFSLDINAQAILNISYKRLCNKASLETHKLVQLLKEEMEKVDPYLAKMMVPACIHQGQCPEMESCGFYKTKSYNRWLDLYHKLYEED